MVIAVCLAAPAVSSAQTTLQLSSTAFDLVRLAPDAPIGVSQFLVSDADAVVFDALTTVGTVGIVVITPGGIRVAEGNIGSVGGTIERRSVSAGAVGPLLDPLGSPGEHIIVSLPGPAAGTWGLEFSAPPGNTAEIPVAVTAIMQSPTRVALVALPNEVVLGGAVTLTLAAFSGEDPLAGASVQAQVLAPGGGVSIVSLLDDGAGADVASGDGLYSAAFVPGSPGLFQAFAEATGVVSGATVVRHGAVAFSVVEPTLALLGDVPVRTVDANGNGLIDEVVLDVSVNVLVAGRFSSRVVLTASNGASLSRNVQADLAAGNTVIPVGFGASELRGFGVDGPYAIGPVEIVFIGDDGAIPADRLDEAGMTPPILLSDLERPQISYAGTSTDSGVDLDGDGPFDRLNVDLSMTFAVAGSYSWSAILFDRDDRQIGFSSGSRFFSAGTSSIPLTFLGEGIGANGVDGPFTVGNLLVNGTGGSLVLRTVTQTSPYLARQFEGYVPTDTTPPTVDVAATPTNIWPPRRVLPVTVSGRITDDGTGVDPSTAAFSVVDEFGVVQPSGPVTLAQGGSFSFVVMLDTSLRKNDVDRHYQITVRAADALGNLGSATVPVRVAKPTQ
jgi:hypothetical protein